MASDLQKINSLSTNQFRYKVRESYLNSAKHINDSYLNLGYDYRGRILQKMTSNELWANPMQKSHFGQLESIINFILEQVKFIKKHFSIAHDSKTLNIN